MAWINCCTICDMEKLILDRKQVICHQCSEAIAKGNLVKLALSMGCRCRACGTFLTKEDKHFAVCKKCTQKIKANYKEIIRQRKIDKQKGIHRFA